MLFVIKRLSLPKNEALNSAQQEGLTYRNEILGNLVNKDTDGDGVPDWEEGLWGTDPTKKETTPGISDSAAIEKLKIAQEAASQTGGTNAESQTPENLTQTDKFSRDLFATIAAATQNGQPLDQATIDKISSSLADHIQNSPVRKIYLLSDIVIAKNDNVQAINAYSVALANIYTKYPINNSVIDVLQKFMVDTNNVDVSALAELDPIIEQTTKIINTMAKMSVPKSLALSHRDLLNALQALLENISDIKLYDTDIIVSLSAISQYSKNTTALDTAIANLKNIINQKLSN